MLAGIQLRALPKIRNWAQAPSKSATCGRAAAYFHCSRIQPNEESDAGRCSGSGICRVHRSLGQGSRLRAASSMVMRFCLQASGFAVPVRRSCSSARAPCLWRKSRVSAKACPYRAISFGILCRQIHRAIWTTGMPTRGNAHSSALAHFYNRRSSFIARAESMDTSRAC